MSKLLKMLSLAALFGALMMPGGCGDDDSVVNPAVVSSPVAATINANGTATTGANITNVTAPGAQGYLAGVSVTLPPNTVITARNADDTPKALTAPLSFTFTSPADSSATASGTNGVPAPTGFTTLTSTSGAIDVAITGAASATFSPAITIFMPVPGKAVGEMVKVYTVKGTAYTSLGSFQVTTGAIGKGVSFQVTELSWKVGDPNPDPNAPTTTEQTTTATTAATTVATTVPATTVVTTAATTVATTVPATTTATTAATTVATTVVTTTVTPSCGTCHGIPPTTGWHTFHVNTQGLSCAICHGPGYSATTVNLTTHNNGVTNIASGNPPGWNTTSRSCTNACHGSKNW